LARKPADQSVSRDDIIIAAADVLQRNGYESATMKDIAAAVNLTAASLYHHFKNKDSLLLAVLERGLDAVIERIEPIVESSLPAARKLRAMTREHIVGLTENTAIGAVMVFEIRSLIHVKAPPAKANADDLLAYQDFIDRRDSFFRRRDYFEGLFRQVLSEGVAQGDFRPIEVPIAAKTLLGAHNWVGVWYRPQGRLNGDEIASFMTDVILKGIEC
jgi:AcrR family transcriptional regulator